jgi:hypothetical protein
MRRATGQGRRACEATGTDIRSRMLCRLLKMAAKLQYQTYTAQ